MTIEQFLAEGPLGAILGLAIIPVLAAVALFGYVAFAVSRRGKKNKMKLGLQPGQKEAAAMAKPQKPQPTRDDDLSMPPAADGGQLDLAILGGVTAAPSPPAEPKPADVPDSQAQFAAAPVARPQPQAGAGSVDEASGASVPAPGEPTELLRLLRQPESGMMLVEIDGQRFTRLVEIKDRKLGQFVLRLAAQLLAFTGGAILTDAGVKSVMAPAAAPLPEPPFSPAKAAPATKTAAPVPPPPPEVEAQFLASLSQAAAPPPPRRAAPARACWPPCWNRRHRPPLVNCCS